MTKSKSLPSILTKHVKHLHLRWHIGFAVGNHIFCTDKNVPKSEVVDTFLSAPFSICNVLASYPFQLPLDPIGIETGASAAPASWRILFRKIFVCVHTWCNDNEMSPANHNTMTCGILPAKSLPRSKYKRRRFTTPPCHTLPGMAPFRKPGHF